MNEGTTYDENIAIFANWVEEMSDDIFTATSAFGVPTCPVVIRRRDGELFGTDEHGHTISGVLVSTYLSAYRKIDRRHKTTMYEAVAGVREATKYVSHEESAVISHARYSWMDRNHMEVGRRAMSRSERRKMNNDRTETMLNEQIGESK